MQHFSASALLAATVMAAGGSFDYMDNGASWADGVCATGRNQSPIDFTNNVSRRTDLVADAYGYFDVKNSHTIGLPAAASGEKPNGAIKMTLDSAAATGAGMLLKRANAADSLWQPLQVHWHAPSEHTLNGNLFPAEMHIVQTHLMKKCYRL